MRTMVLGVVAVLAAGATAMAQPASSGGTTSGPASGQPTTLGTGGTTTATPIMKHQLKHKGGATVQHEAQGQAGGTLKSVRPGVAGGESGAPAAGAPKP